MTGTTEKNIMIAEYMNKEIITDGISLFDTDYKPLPKYDELWDELMPVIYKLKWFENFEDEIYSDINDGLLNGLRNQTYDAVVTLIKKLKNK